MSHSCFSASVFAEATNVFLTLHRLEFPANERVHIQVSVLGGTSCISLLRSGFYGNNAHELPTAYPNFSKNCQEYISNKTDGQHKSLSVTTFTSLLILDCFITYYKIYLAVESRSPLPDLNPFQLVFRRANQKGSTYRL